MGLRTKQGPIPKAACVHSALAEAQVRYVVFVLSLMAAGMLAAILDVDAASKGGPSPIKMAHFFQAASAPETEASVDPESAKLLAEIGFRRIRLINAERDSTFDSSNNRFLPSIRLQAGLDLARKLGCSAHVVVGQTLPLGLSGPAGNPREPDGAYGNYAKSVLLHLMAACPSLPVLVEVSNELDATAYQDNLWTLSSIPPVGSEERYQHLLSVYQAWAKAAQEVDPASKAIRLAGPATALAGSAYAPFNWFERFPKDLRASRSRLDLFTYHYYGDQGALGDGIPHPDLPSLETQLKSIRKWLDAAEYRGTGIGITEWGPSCMTADPTLGRCNNEASGAAWCAAFAHRAAEEKLETASYLLANDRHQGAETGVPTEASLLYYHRGKLSPKPPHLVAKLLLQMEGQPCGRLTSPLQGVGAAASRSTSSFSLLIYNTRLEHRFSERKILDHSKPGILTIRARNLPFKGRAVLTLSRINEEQGPTRLTRSESMVHVPSGRSFSFDLSLGASEVVLVQIRKPSAATQ